MDRSGHVLGQHQGLPLYTVGQRRGLGISADEPLYVQELDTDRNAVVVGRAGDLGGSELLAEDVSYVSGEPPPGPVRVTVKIRYQAHESTATWLPVGLRSARILFDRRQRDITPGQGVVAYQGDVLIGGGIIA
jgi:tRNA-specific 2-thiouridylase